MLRYIAVIILFGLTIPLTGHTDRLIKDLITVFGDGSGSDVVLEADVGSGANNPRLKYDNTENAWQFTNDGIDFLEFGSGSGGGSAGISLVEDRSFEKGVAGSGYSADLTSEEIVVLLSPTNTKSLKVVATDTPLAGKFSTYTYNASINSEWHEGMPITVKGWIKWPSTNASIGSVTVSDTIDELQSITLESKDEWQEFKVKTHVGATSTIRTVIKFGLEDGQVGDLFYLDMLDVIAGHEGDSPYKLSGAHFVGSASWNDDCYFTDNPVDSTASFTDYDNETSCTRSADGSVTTNTSGFSFDLLNVRTDGTYTINFNAQFLTLYRTASAACQWVVTDGTSVFGLKDLADVVNGENLVSDDLRVEGVRFNSYGNKNIKIQKKGRGNTGVECSIGSLSAESPMKATVHFYPDETSTVVTHKSLTPDMAGFATLSFVEINHANWKRANGDCVLKSEYPDYARNVKKSEGTYVYGECTVSTTDDGVNLPDMETNNLFIRAASDSLALGTEQADDARMLLTVTGSNYNGAVNSSY